MKELHARLEYYFPCSFERGGSLLVIVGVLATAALVLVATLVLTRDNPQPEASAGPDPTATPAIATEATNPGTTLPDEPLTPTEPPARLAVLGDVGTGDEVEQATADLVAAYGETDPFDGLVLLGDNVYPDGDPDRLDATVFDPFAPVLDRGASLLPVLGNHDVRDGNGPGQVEELGMPGRWYATGVGPALFIGLDSTLAEDSDQREWLETTLANSSAEIIIVAMHHPAYSAGYHGSDERVQDTWVPLFEEYEVDLVLAGHDHDYQRSIPLDGVTYVVSGGGAKLRPAGTADFTAHSASVYHFVDIEVWDDRLVLHATSRDGVFDQATIWAS